MCLLLALETIPGVVCQVWNSQFQERYWETGLNPAEVQQVEKRVEAQEAESSILLSLKKKRPKGKSEGQL